MLLSIFVTLLISIITIGLIHWTIEYLKTKFTVKKTKSMDETQIKKYKEIINELEQHTRTDDELQDVSNLGHSNSDDEELREFAMQCLQE